MGVAGVESGVGRGGRHNGFEATSASLGVGGAMMQSGLD